MKKILLTHCLLSLSAAWLSAEENTFPDGANWLILFDVEAFHESRMGKFILGKMEEEPNINQKIQGLKNAFGVDLLKIREVSAFGSGEKDLGTALIKGGINSKQLEGFASLNEKVEIDKVGNKKTYSFKKGSLGILSGDSVAIASNKKLLEEVLVPKIDNKKPAPLQIFVRSIKKDQPPIIWFAANLLKINRLQNKIKQDQLRINEKKPEEIRKSLTPEMVGEVVFKKFKNMAMFMNETEEHILMQVYFQSATHEAAEHLENIFRSWPSLLALAKGINLELDEVMNHVKFSVVREKKSVGMTALFSHSFFETKVNEELEKKKNTREDSK